LPASIGRAEEFVAFFGDVRNGSYFLIAQADQPFSKASFGFVMRQARCS